MSRIPITKKQATELVKSLPVNRSVAASAARAGGSAVARRLTPSVLRAPTLPTRRNITSTCWSRTR